MASIKAEKAAPAPAGSDLPKLLRWAASDFEATEKPCDFQSVCCALNRSSELAVAAEAVHALGPRALLALFAELLAGRDPAEAIRSYAAISPVAIARAVAALEHREAPQ